MSVDKVIYARLTGNAAVTAIVGSTTPRIHPVIGPQSEQYPRITYQQISRDSLNMMQGPCGVNTYRMQVNCWARTFEGVRDLAQAVKKSYADGGPLDGFRGTSATITVHRIACEDESDFPESPTEVGDSKPVYGKSIDFLVTIEE